MGKGKSSASSATRKKHAKKHAPPPEEPVPKTKKDKKARGKKEPRQKIYIPPVKPAPVQPDPLETTGLAHSLPADLLVVLRSFKKKAEVTKVHALEELQAGWVDKCGEDETMGYTVVEMLPVWLHHAPALFLHPSRRVRVLTATLHLSLLRIASVKEQIFFFLRETASTSQVESFLGSWCVAASDVDKAVSTAAMKSWKEAMEEFKLDEAAQAALLEFVQRTALDPAGIYMYLNPVQPSITPAQSQSNSRKGSGRNTPAVQPRKDNPEQLLRSKLEDSEENEEDRKARLRFGALGALRWMLESLETLPEGLLSLFGNPALLTSLQPKRVVPWLDMESFGHAQPTVRRNMWALLQTLLSKKKGQLQEVASELARAILRSAFIEKDSNVQSVMWYPLLLFLKEFPNAWELEANASQDDDNEDSDNDDEAELKLKPPATTSAAYQEFLQFLQLGCSGSPLEGYPTIIIILSTISSSIIAASSPTPLQDLFSSFWAALDGRALSSLNRAASSAAFLSSLLECMILILKRLKSTSVEADVVAKLVKSGDSVEGDVDVAGFSKKLVQEQLARMWQEVLDGKLKVPEDQAAKSIVKTVNGLKDVDPDFSDAAWNTLSSSILASSLTHPKPVAHLVKGLQNASRDSEGWGDKLNSVIARLAEQSLEGFVPSFIDPNETGEQAKQKQALLTALLNTFKQDLFAVSEGFREQVDAAISNEKQAYELLQSSPAVFIAVLGYRGFDEAGMGLAQGAWKAVLSKLVDSATPKAEREGGLNALASAARAGTLPKYLRVYESAEEDGALDDFIGCNVSEVLGGRGDGVDLLRVALKHHDFFLSKSALLDIFETLCGSLKTEISAAFEDPFFLPSEGGSNGVIPWSALENLFSLVLSTYEVLLASPHASAIASVIDNVAPDAFLFGYLLPLCESVSDVGEQASFGTAKQVWKRWLKDAVDSSEDAEMGKSRASKGLREVREKLTGFILGTKTRVLPQTVLTLLLKPGASSDGKTGSDAFFFSAHPEFSTDTTLEFLPGIAELDAMLAFLLPNTSPNASMGVLEPLVPPSTAYPHSLPVRIQSTILVSASNNLFNEGRYGVGNLDVTGYDRYGYSAYARAVSALVSVLARDRATLKAREGVEMLKHAGALEVFAWDALCLPHSLGSSDEPQKVFGESVLLRESEGESADGAGKEVWNLTELISKIEQVSAYAFLAAGGREPWKKYVVESLAGATAKVSPSNPDVPTLDERGNIVIGGVKKTMHATMNLLSWFVLDSIAKSVQSEVDLKAGVAILASIDGEGSAKEQAKGMKSKVVLKARALRRVLERVFDNYEDNDDDGSGMGKEEVDAWVGYARRIERIAPLTSSTILATLTSLGLDSPRLDRARNEFAASLLGIQPPRANTEGLELVRILGLCAPNDDTENDGFSTRVTTGSNGVSLGGRVASRRGGSDTIMLPVQRAVNVVRACQNWVEGQQKAGGESDDEDSEEEEEGPSEDLESAMLAVFVGLAPILQNVIGKHWEFMWDVVETVVENSTLEDETTLLGLSHALRFVRVMEELVRTNKQLNAEWRSRRVAVLGNVRDLLLEEDSGDPEDTSVPKPNSIPRSVCRELILSIVRGLPDELMDHSTLGKTCHLVADSSIEVQRLSYDMLRKAAEKRTEWVVIEVGVGSLGGEDGGETTEEVNALGMDEADQAAPASSPTVDVEAAMASQVTKEDEPGKKVERRKDGRRRGRKEIVVKDEGPSLLPKELLAIIQRDEEIDLFGWMLGWMLVFDLFKDASFKVKSMYIEQLRNLDLIGQRLLPVIVHLLRLDEGLNKAVKVDLWAVEEFHVAHYDPISAPALAAHLYYRALLSVPSLISTWVLACKDRQLSSAITTLTSTHFSSLIIRTELAHLKSPEGLSELSGEGLSVKVLGGSGSGVGGEVVAAYSVDEHQLELRLRIPSDWPLHKIEVRDEKRVGVDENRWRAWVLGVQQTIWIHNGRIVDGLSLWKKNVIGHFEGQGQAVVPDPAAFDPSMPPPKNRAKATKSRARKPQASGSSSSRALGDSSLRDGYAEDVDDADGWAPIANMLCSIFELPGGDLSHLNEHLSAEETDSRYVDLSTRSGLKKVHGDFDAIYAKLDSQYQRHLSNEKIRGGIIVIYSKMCLDAVLRNKLFERGLLDKLLPLFEMDSMCHMVLRSLSKITHHGGVEIRTAIAFKAHAITTLVDKYPSDPVICELAVSILSHTVLACTEGPEHDPSIPETMKKLNMTKILQTGVHCMTQPFSDRSCIEHGTSLLAWSTLHATNAHKQVPETAKILVAGLRSPDWGMRSICFGGLQRLHRRGAQLEMDTVNPQSFMSLGGRHHAVYAGNDDLSANRNLYSLGIKLSKIILATEYSIWDSFYDMQRFNPLTGECDDRDFKLPFNRWSDALPLCAKVIREKGVRAERDAANVLDIKYLILRQRTDDAAALGREGLKHNPSFAYYYYAISIAADRTNGLQATKQGLKCKDITTFVKFQLMQRAVDHAAELGFETLQYMPEVGGTEWELGISLLRSALEDAKRFMEEAPPDNRYMKIVVYWYVLLTVVVLEDVDLSSPDIQNAMERLEISEDVAELISNGPPDTMLRRSAKPAVPREW